jgi:malonyl-CoA/methylmalonyl-CoA synthetase
MPEKTAEEFTPDGWFKTGDVGCVDEHGYVTIVGRSKDLIISGGYNVYPAEVESVLNDLPGVAESAVVGVPHPDFGEVGVAVFTAQPGVSLQCDAVLAQVRAVLANFKVPKRCFVVPEIAPQHHGQGPKERAPRPLQDIVFHTVMAIKKPAAAGFFVANSVCLTSAE